jgi:hypothetical protein
MGRVKHKLLLVLKDFCVVCGDEYINKSHNPKVKTCSKKCYYKVLHVRRVH